jgi:hypothetical protein
MSNYAQLRDPPGGNADERAFAAGKVVAKFCNFGIVTSHKWISAYVTILDGVFRLYDSQESCVQVSFIFL